MDASELLKCYAAGETVFFDVDLRGEDLRGAELSSVGIIRADLSGSDLSRANLSEACLCETVLSGANLFHTKLNRADLSFTELITTNLIRADLIKVNLSGADLRGAKLNEANLSEANLTEANLTEAVLTEAKLNRADLTGAYLIQANLVQANLSGANLRGADLRGADLRGANLVQANLSEANLSGADLSNANLAGVDLTNAKLNKTKIDGTILAYQKVSEELQRENQELRTKLSLLETQVEKLVEKQVERRLIANQGIKAKKSLTWEGMRFRSNPEREIAKVFDEMGVMFFPLPSGRVMTEEGMTTREVDFLVCSRGKWGILECDGISHILNSIKKGQMPSAALDHKRDNDFNRHGQWFIKRFTDEECKKNPRKVVREFLDMLHKFHEDQTYLITGNFAEAESLLPRSNPSLQSEDSSLQSNFKRYQLSLFSEDYQNNERD